MMCHCLYTQISVSTSFVIIRRKKNHLLPCDANILADDLIPIKTLRETISCTMEINDNSTENAATAYQVQVQRGNQASPFQNEGSTKAKDAAVQSDVVLSQTMKKERTGKVPYVSEAARDSMPVKEHSSLGDLSLAIEEVQQKPASATGHIYFPSLPILSLLYCKFRSFFFLLIACILKDTIIVYSQATKTCHIRKGFQWLNKSAQLK